MTTDMIRHQLVMGVSHADAELCPNSWPVREISPEVDHKTRVPACSGTSEATAITRRK